MLATLGTRACQILFTTIVLGISISAARWQVYGSVPATTSYDAFAGALGLLNALIGLAGIWVSAIPELIMSAVDTITSVLLLAGGIALAVGVRGVNCDASNDASAYYNNLLNGGCEKGDCGVNTGFSSGQRPERDAELGKRCHTMKADAAFLFLSFLACVANAVLCFMAHKRGGGVTHTAV